MPLFGRKSNANDAEEACIDLFLAQAEQTTLVSSVLAGDTTAKASLSAKSNEVDAAAERCVELGVELVYGRFGLLKRG